MTLKRLSWPRPSFSLKKSCSGYVRAMSRRMTYHTFFVREGCVILLSYHPQIHHRIEEMMKERKKKKGWKPFHRRMWLWYTRRIATWPASHWRRTAVARRRLWNDAGSLCGRGPWRRHFASCTYWPSRPPDGPKGSTDPLRCRPNAPLDCWHWNLSG